MDRVKGTSESACFVAEYAYKRIESEKNEIKMDIFRLAELFQYIIQQQLGIDIFEMSPINANKILTLLEKYDIFMNEDNEFVYEDQKLDMSESAREYWSSRIIEEDN